MRDVQWYLYALRAQLHALGDQVQPAVLAIAWPSPICVSARC